MHKHLAPSRRVIAVWLLAVFSLTLLACDVASLVSQGNAPAEKAQEELTQATGSPRATSSTSSTSKTSVPPPAADLQSRIGDSLNRTVIMDKKALPSYHLEASGTEPVLNKTTKKIESQPFTFKADVSGDNIYFLSVEKGEKETRTEAYIIGASAKDGGKGYTVEGGKIKEAMLVSLSWVMLPLDWGMPLIYGAMGPTARGTEAVDGRTAEKYDLDTAKAPVGAQGVMKGIGLNVYSAKGTAWVDKETGALLKMTMDYERDVNDAMGGGGTVGKGSGHIELVVTQVGKVTVNLPDPSQVGSAGPTPKAGATAVPTKGAAPKAGPTASPTAQPAGIAAKVGQRVVLQGQALTVTKAELSTKQADAGNTWVVVRITVENVSNARNSIDLSQFEFIDKSGIIHDDVWNGASAPEVYSSDILEYTDLAPGGKLENQIILIQLKKTATPGLKMHYTWDDENSITWNLGL